ncbi:MAG: serine/threonine-protein kinase, partial [Deltaproteobacteria bacterium]|nr:serine/threonine-protein kinase [Deltaproteobacteria bacterium]
MDPPNTREPAATARPAPPGPFSALASDDELTAMAAHMGALGWERWAWCVGFFFDAFALKVVWPGASWPVVLGARSLGLPLQPALAWVARRRRLPAPTVGRLTLLYTLVAVALMGVPAAEFGGLTSPYVFSLVSFAMAAPLVAEVRRSRLFILFGAWFVVWTAVLAVAAAYSPDIARQWHDTRALTVYFGQWIFLALIFGAGMHAAFEIGALRRQLREARKLAGYRLKVRLGSGGMNEVWLAWDESHHRDVALKILHDQPSEAVAQRFEREAEALRALSSPHTVRVLDFGASDDGVRFLAMERLVGIDLERLVRDDGPMPPARAAHLARQACSSLGEAHRAGIVHRDVKPSNLFLSALPDGDHLTVIDFGIARRVDVHEARLTAIGDAIGTPHFIAPESLLGDTSDARGDLYGLGATLFFLLTGTRPFEGLTGLALVGAVSGATPDAPSTRAPGVSPALDAIVLRCLAAVPCDRFADMAALDAALAALDLPWTAADAAVCHARSERASPMPRRPDEATR